MDIVKLNRAQKRVADGKHLTFGLAKNATEEQKALLAELSDPGDDGMWGVATAEVVDTMDDVVRVDGMSWDLYHNPPASHLKILAGHLRILSDGTAPVIGRVEEFKRLTGTAGDKVVKLVAFRMSWAKDGDGNLTPLAKAYKDLFDGGYLDSFSVGMWVVKYDIIDHDDERWGLDIQESVLFEVSAVTVPALACANRIKELTPFIETLRAEKCQVDVPDTFIRTEADGKQYISVDGHKAIVDDLLKTVLRPHGKNGSTTGTLKSSDAGDPKIADALSLVARGVEKIERTVAGMSERLDTLESAVVLLTQSKGHDEQDRETEPTTTNALSDAAKQLREAMKFLGK